jgi:hypothetical protein
MNNPPETTLLHCCGGPVQACGDGHLLKFGMFASTEHNLVFDLKHLVTSFVIAGREKTCAMRRRKATAMDCVRSYREHLCEYSGMSPLEV